MSDGVDMFDRGDVDPTLAVVAIAALALLARVIFLGDRVAHFDEGRVAWWTLEFARTGRFSYQFIIHGPFVQHVTTWVWAVLGPSDFSARLVIAVAGGLLPLSALLFREHLRDVEVVCVALFLALNPVLLYYSRFFRSSVLVAAFMFVAFGLLVRAYDTGRAAYVYGAAALVALGFAAKENAVVYLLVWLGAAALVVDYRLLLRPDGETGFARLGRGWSERAPGTDDLTRWAGHAVVSLAIVLALTVFFYAPRAGGGAEPDLYRALVSPGQLPAVWDAMVADVVEGMEYWFSRSGEPGCHKDNLIDAYLCFLGRSLETLAGYAFPLVAFAVGGFVAERYGAVRTRQLVMFAGYWGFVSVLGYPLGTDIYGAWIMVNALVPLAIPAGVGLGLVVRRGWEAYETDDRVSVGLAAVLLVLVIGQMAVVGAQSSYAEPTSPDNGLVQYAQPAQDWRPVLDRMRSVAPRNQGPDVLVYGSYFVDGDRSAVRTPACVEWFDVLPIPWYTTLYGADVACANTSAQLDEQAQRRPPVVISRASNADVLRQRFPDYEERRMRLRTTGVETVVLLDPERT